MAKLVKKHPLAIRWFHWLNFPMLAVMIWSGLLIYWANDIYGVRFGETEIVKLFPARIFGQEAPITKVVNGKAVDNVLPG